MEIGKNTFYNNNNTSTIVNYGDNIMCRRQHSMIDHMLTNMIKSTIIIYTGTSSHVLIIKQSG